MCLYTVECTADSADGYPRPPTIVHVRQCPTHTASTQTNSQDQYQYGIWKNSLSNFYLEMVNDQIKWLIHMLLNRIRYDYALNSPMM